MRRQIDRKVTKQIRIDTGLHRIVKTEASRRLMTIRELVEIYICDGLDKDNVKY